MSASALQPLAPHLAVTATAALVLVADLFTPPEHKRALGWLTAALLGAVLALTFALDLDGTAAAGAYAGSAWATFFGRAVLVSGVLAALGGIDHAAERWRHRQGEYWLLLCLSLVGMMLIPGARDLLLLLVAFELMGTPLYVLASYGKTDDGKHGAEAGLKLYVVGAGSTAVTLFGLALVAGMAGTTSLAGLSQAPATPLLMLGTMLLLAGMGFKIGVAPFHMWVPDTYQGAATPFVAFLSVAPKVAGLAALGVLFLDAFGAHRAHWLPVVATVSVLTMLAGNLLAIPQTSAKRLLAYSGVAQMGYLLMGFATGTAEGAGMMLFYAAAYVVTNLGAFLVVHAVARAEGTDEARAFDGLARRSPWLAMALLLFLLSLAGIPFVAGFWAKLYVFIAAWHAGMGWLVLTGAVLAVVALYYYLGLARAAYVNAPANPARIEVPPALAVAIVACLLAVVIMGAWPGPVVDAAMRAAGALLG